jgi:ankyrin repeat protein
LKIQNPEDLNLFEARFNNRVLLTLASSGDLTNLASFSRLGLNLNLKCPLTGSTALHLAVANNKTEVVEYLLTKDCELAKDYEG